MYCHMCVRNLSTSLKDSALIEIDFIAPSLKTYLHFFNKLNESFCHDPKIYRKKRNNTAQPGSSNYTCN